MFTLLNPVSFILGLIAWLLPIINILKYKNSYNNKWYILSIISMATCAISLYFQILYNYHLVNIEDWSALMDIIGALVLVSSVLIVVTIILNIITLSIYHRKKIK